MKTYLRGKELKDNFIRIEDGMNREAVEVILKAAKNVNEKKKPYGK